MVWIVIIIVIAMGMAWAGRAAWRAHKNIVSLHVHNAPVAEVIRSLRWQTWEPIIADTNLNGRVTLDLDNVPLTDALDKLAEQSGAMAGVCYAVYQSSYNLEQLKKSLLRGHTDCYGWTNLTSGWANTKIFTGSLAGNANDPSDTNLPVFTRPITSGSNEVGSATLNSEDISAALSNGTQAALKQALANGNAHVTTKIFTHGFTNGFASTGINPDRMSQQAQQALQEALSKKSGQTIIGREHFGSKVLTTTTSYNNNGESEPGESWSSENLLLEEHLLPQLRHNANYTASPANAEALARSTHAKTKTLYVLKQMLLPGLAITKISDFATKFLAGAGKSNGPSSQATLQDELTSEVQRANMEKYVHLTPEQRAENARRLHQKPTNN